jgi:RND family efflux transporter MFP subunit
MRAGTLVMVLGLAALGGTAWYLSREAAPAAAGGGRPPFVLPVSLAEIEQGDLRPASTLAGEVRSLQRATLAFERAGTITTLPKREGDRVAAGEVLAELDTREARLALAGAEAEATLARSELTKLEAGARKEELDRLEAEVEARTAERDRARLEWQRVQALLESGVSSRAEYDRLDAALRAAEALLAVAKHRQAEAVAGTRAEDLAVARAKVALAEARIAQAQHEVSLARLVAPFGGALVRRLRSSGDRVAPGETVWELVDTSAREVVVDLPAAIAAQLARDGCSVLEPKSGASAQVQTIVLAEAAEATTRNVRAWLRLAPEADARLAPGVAVDVTLPWRPLTGAWLVPNDALRRTEQGTLIVTANATPEAGLKAAFVPVKVLGSANGKTAIEAQGTPLTAGLKVVVVGVEMAFPDAPLMPRN